MAKHNTIQLLKFKRLVRDLKEPDAHVLGHLEMLWLQAHANESPIFESLDDVEIAAGWDGEPGTLANAMLKSRWLDQRDEGSYECHDYWDHAPHYVIDRIRKRRERRKYKERPGHVPDTSRKNPGQSSPPTDTDTDTDKRSSPGYRSYADKRLSPTRARGGKPEPLGDISASAISQFEKQEREWWRRVSALVEPYAMPWWKATMQSYLGAGGQMCELEELVKRHEDASSPALREAKGIGAFTKPNGAAKSMMKEMTRLCKAVGVRWLKYPEKEAM